MPRRKIVTMNKRSIYISDLLWNELENIAQDMNISTSELIRIWLTEKVKRVNK